MAIFGLKTNYKKIVLCYFCPPPLPMQKNWVKMVPKQVFTGGGFKSPPSTIGVWPTQLFGPWPPLGGRKIFQKEQPAISQKPSLSIHIEHVTCITFPKQKILKKFLSRKEANHLFALI